MQICLNRSRVDGRVGVCKCITLLTHCVTHIYKVTHEKTQYLSGFPVCVHQMCHFFPEEIAYRKKIENIMFHTTLYIFTFSGKKSDTLTQQTESLHAAGTKKRVFTLSSMAKKYGWKKSHGVRDTLGERQRRQPPCLVAPQAWRLPWLSLTGLRKVTCLG